MRRQIEGQAQECPSRSIGLARKAALKQQQLCYLEYIAKVGIFNVCEVSESKCVRDSRRPDSLLIVSCSIFLFVVTADQQESC